MIIDLAESVVDTLKRNMNLSDHEVRLMPSGQPLPTMGETFISVYPYLWNFPGEQEYQLHEEYGIECTVTRRINATPWSHVGNNTYVTGAKSIVRTVRDIILNIHNNIELIDEAGTQQDGNYKISTLLQVDRVDPSPQVVDAMWFWTADTDPTEVMMKQKYGLVMSVSFNRAERVQPMYDEDLE